VRAETVPTLVDRVQGIYEEGTNVVLQIDFKDKDAVELAYWVLKNMTNSAGVLANEWCIYNKEQNTSTHPLSTNFQWVCYISRWYLVGV
jgi:hypothetical protein